MSVNTVAVDNTDNHWNICCGGNARENPQSTLLLPTPVAKLYIPVSATLDGHHINIQKKKRKTIFKSLNYCAWVTPYTALSGVNTALTYRGYHISGCFNYTHTETQNFTLRHKQSFHTHTQTQTNTAYPASIKQQLFRNQKQTMLYV